MPDRGNFDEQALIEEIHDYREYLESNPNDPRIWFDLGLAYKWLRDWKSCIEANRRALELSGGEGEPAWWNLGIAATAIRDWTLARRAWRGYGLQDIAEGNDPIVCDYGSTPVRLPHGEVVWGERIDPARVIVRNIPFPEHGYRWGDIVLHDGAPNGERESNGQRYSVFDVLERWCASEIPTVTVDVECSNESDSAALIALLHENHFAAEDWTANTRQLCAACSEGMPDGHDHPFVGTTEQSRSFGIACTMGLARDLLEQWRSASPKARRYGQLLAA